MPGDAQGVRAWPLGCPWACWRGAVSPREDRRRADDWNWPSSAAPVLRGPPSAPQGSLSVLLVAESSPARRGPILERRQASVPVSGDEAAVLWAVGGRQPRRGPRDVQPYSRG